MSTAPDALRRRTPTNALGFCPGSAHSPDQNRLWLGPNSWRPEIEGVLLTETSAMAHFRRQYFFEGLSTSSGNTTEMRSGSEHSGGRRGSDVQLDAGGRLICHRRTSNSCYIAATKSSAIVASSFARLIHLRTCALAPLVHAPLPPSDPPTGERLRPARALPRCMSRGNEAAMDG